MKITAIECIPVDVPIVPEFQIRGSLGSHVKSPFLLVRMHTDEGLKGLGEVSCTPLWSGEDQVTAAHLIANFLAPALTGEDPRDIERLTAKIRRTVAANPFTKSALEMALWDILGKSVGLPVYRLLGKQGLGTEQMPEAGQPILHTIGYHMHAGGHGTMPGDWEHFLKFMDMHLHPGQ